MPVTVCGLHPEAQDMFKQGGDVNYQAILNMGDAGTNRYGNSMEDLRLSGLGWNFGKLTQSGAFTSVAQQIQWLQDGIAQ
jgi:hypothetical protein